MGIQLTVIDQLQPLGEWERMPAGRLLATDSADNNFTGIEPEGAPDVSWTSGNMARWNTAARELEPGLPGFSFFQLYRQDEISRILGLLRNLDAQYLELGAEEAEEFTRRTEELIELFEYASKLPDAGVSVS